MDSANRELGFLMGKLGLGSVQGPRKFDFILVTGSLLAFTLTEIITRLFFFLFVSGYNR